jgi:hypothetical protein
MQQCLLKSLDRSSGKPPAYICVEVDHLEVAFSAKSSMAAYLELINSIMSVICLLNSSLSCLGYTQPKIKYVCKPDGSCPITFKKFAFSSAFYASK